MQANLEEAERRIAEARRTGAEVLNLGDLALGELPASLGDLTHLKALYLGSIGLNEAGESEWDHNPKSSHFTNLAPLAGLQQLHSLDLADTEVRDLAPLAGLLELQSLNLGNTNVMDLAPLARLQRLLSLDLNNTEVTDLSPLAGLQELQSLTLDSTKVRDLAPLAGLRGLLSLDLATSQVRDLTPLVGLQELLELDLTDTEVEDLAPLAGLLELQSLDLLDTWVTDLAPLAGLQTLQYLNVAATGVTDLAPLAGLQELRSLHLEWTRVSDLTPLAGLQELQSLNLSSTRVTDLAPLAGLQELQSLNLSSTRVTDLAPLAELQWLQDLDLYSCRPAIPVSLLRVLVELPCLTKLVADEASGVPQEILSKGLFDNCLPRVRTYLAELDLGTEAESEVKVILLGNGRVGKTQLCRRLRGELFDSSVPSTHGVQIWREELRIQTGGEEQTFQVNWWDFGGQDIYHGTHALFLRSRAVFLILWTPELENQEESEENGIPLRNQPLTYWLDYVRSLAGEGSPVIVVQSQCDRFADQRPSPPKPDGLGFFQTCSYSAKTDLGREAFEAHLRDAIRSLLERNGALTIGRGRAELRRRLYEWRSEDQKCEPWDRQHRTITLEEFRALCDEVGGIVSWEHALDYLHHTGVVFYQPDLFSDCIVLDQTWALDAVYTVFHRGKAAPWLRDSGRFTREDLALMAWQEYSINEQKLFLGLMESCGVCFPCGETARGELRYVAPDLLPRFETVAGRLHAWKEEAVTPALRMEYRFLHPAVIRNLMSKVGRQAGDTAEYWKYGLWLKDGRRDSQLLVQLVDTSTDQAPGAGALVLKAQGRDPLGLLREIRKAISQQRVGEEPEELLTIDGTTVARSALKSVIGDQVLDIQDRPVMAAPFSAFFADRDHDPSGASMTGEASGIEITPQRLTADEQPREIWVKNEQSKARSARRDTSLNSQPESSEILTRPKVFVSYSHKDADALDQLRAFLRPLERDGTIDFWFDSHIKGGDDWRAKIEEVINSATAALLLVSQRFIASDFIAQEEVPRILAREAAGQLTVLPVFLSPSSVQDENFDFLDPRTGQRVQGKLTNFQGYGTPDKTLRDLKSSARQREYYRLTTRLRSMAADVRGEVVPATAAPEYDPGNALVTRKAPALDITPQRLTADEKPREIYISYAWGDDSPEGKILTETVEGLCSALEADGFLPVRDRDRIHPGELISAFINRLTHADHVVAVISDKYLRSPYCMYEIYRLWQRVQTDPADLAQCLVPIVLPGPSFKNLRERQPYMEYWAEEAESLEALIRNPKLKPSRESWEEVRLVREFAHHVDAILVFLNDVLMERRLEVSPR